MKQTRQIIRLALPLILQLICLQLQVWIDQAMLGHVNVEYFSAVGNSTAPYHTITSAITAICSGTAILVAHSIGAGDRERVRKIAQSSLLGSALMSVAAFLFFFFGSEGLFHMMGLQSPILEYSLAYIRVLSLSALILGPVSAANSIAQGLGYTKIIMIHGLTGNALNIFLDWVLIFGHFGLPAMGLTGAAWATVIANFCSAPISLLFVLRSSKMPVKLQFRESFSKLLRPYRQVLALGIPSGLEASLFNLGNLVLMSFLNRLDMAAAGIYTLVFSIELVPLLITNGFANAGLTLVGQNIGAHNLKEAKRAGFLSLYLSEIVCVLVSILFLLIPRQILSLFTPDVQTLDTAVPYLMFICWILFPKTINNVMGPAIRGMGDTRWMLYTQIFGTVFTIAAGYWLILGSGLGLMGIFITLLADEALRGIANLIYFIRKTKI